MTPPGAGGGARSRRGGWVQLVLSLALFLATLVAGVWALFRIEEQGNAIGLATVLFVILAMLGSAASGAFRRATGRRPARPERRGRPDRDRHGRPQETEPYARIAVWMSPAAGAVALVLGGIMIVALAPRGPSAELFVTAGLTLLFVVNGILGGLYAARALRDDAETTAGRDAGKQDG